MKYSAPKQTDMSNAQRLWPAWMFHKGDMRDGTKWPARSAFEFNPLVVNGVMHVTKPFSRVIAVDPETSKELWSFDPSLDLTESANLFINRGAGAIIF
jgi:quinoprotein glucose dehydrogenase